MYLYCCLVKVQTTFVILRFSRYCYNYNFSSQSFHISRSIQTSQLTWFDHVTHSFTLTHTMIVSFIMKILLKSVATPSATPLP